MKSSVEVVESGAQVHLRVPALQSHVKVKQLYRQAYNEYYNNTQKARFEVYLVKIYRFVATYVYNPVRYFDIVLSIF